MNNDTLLSLNIETSTTLCSVSLGKNDICTDCIEINDGKYHSEKLHGFIQEILRRNNLKIQDISVISVSYGPGSYTGLRIGAATAKTLSYALNIPLVTLSSLQIQVFGAIEAQVLQSQHVASIMKAREQKIYLGVYANNGEEIVKPQAFLASKENLELLINPYKEIAFVGKEKDIISGYSIIEIQTSARYMVKEVYKRYLKNQFSEIIYFEPIYI